MPNHRTRPKCAAVKVLRALEDASEASEGRMMGFTLGLDDWHIGENAFRVDDYPRGEMDARFISELSRDRRRLKYIVGLCKAVERSASELLALHERALEPITAKLSKGVAIFPDELLGLIFKYATHDEYEGTRHAQWLSQVSQRFRRIALGDRTLWSIQFQCYDSVIPTAIFRNFSRSGLDSDLHLVVNCDNDTTFTSDKHFISACSREASRWKSLTLIGNWEDGEDTAQATIGGTLDGLMEATELDLPRLQELRLIERRHDKYGKLSWYTYEDDFTGEVLWTTPNLRVLRCIEYIPPPVLPFESIATLALSLTLLPGDSDDQFIRMCSFLVERPNLLDLDLDLINLDDDETTLETNITINSTFSFPSLTSFRLSLSHFERPQEISWIPAPFMKALLMPNLERFWLSTDLLYFPLDLTPDPLRHPRITALTVEFPRPQSKSTVLWRRSGDNREPLFIPLQKFPNIFSLSVTTWLSALSFSPSTADHHQQPVVEGASLQELNLRSCRNMDFEGLRDTVRSLKDVGASEGLERVAIQMCDSLEYDEVVEVLGKENLRFSRS